MLRIFFVLVMINDSLTTHLFPRPADTFLITFHSVVARLLIVCDLGLSSTYVAYLFLDVPEDSSDHMTH